ncbi:MAG: hypothetical protein IPO13_13695 [Rhodocyclaceae bacterium]|nr:hypothetical protein [Rhodocyclaceae bacterium]
MPVHHRQTAAPEWIPVFEKEGDGNCEGEKNLKETPAGDRHKFAKGDKNHVTGFMDWQDDGMHEVIHHFTFGQIAPRDTPSPPCQ